VESSRTNRFGEIAAVAVFEDNYQDSMRYLFAFSLVLPNLKRKLPKF
jgi:hypothetical protein